MGNPKILVVDDFEMMRFQLKKELAAMGYSNVTEAPDGTAAMDALLAASDEKPFDIVFCDWNMPKATGLEVLEFCRNLPVYQKLPFVMVTAEAEQEAVVKAIKAGASDYIVKPIAGEALQTRVKSIFSRLLKIAA
jgi:two-component system, chemotaxis family, chemotaxis protein CheY